MRPGWPRAAGQRRRTSRRPPRSRRPMAERRLRPLPHPRPRATAAPSCRAPTGRAGSHAHSTASGLAGLPAFCAWTLRVNAWAPPSRLQNLAHNAQSRMPPAGGAVRRARRAPLAADREGAAAEAPLRPPTAPTRARMPAQAGRRGGGPALWRVRRARDVGGAAGQSPRGQAARAAPGHGRAGGRAAAAARPGRRRGRRQRGRAALRPVPGRRADARAQGVPPAVRRPDPVPGALAGARCGADMHLQLSAVG